MLHESATAAPSPDTQDMCNLISTIRLTNCYFHTYNGSNHCVVLDESLTFMKLLTLISPFFFSPSVQ